MLVRNKMLKATYFESLFIVVSVRDKIKFDFMQSIVIILFKTMSAKIFTVDKLIRLFIITLIRTTQCNKLEIKTLMK